MKLIELRKELKNELASLNIETEDVDFIISEILNIKRTNLLLVDEISEEQEKEIREKIELRKQTFLLIKFSKKHIFMD